MPLAKYALGLDFGTNSVRALLVDIRNGREVATAVFPYPTGKAGIILDAPRPQPGPPEPGRLPARHRGRRSSETLAQARASDRAFKPEPDRRHRRRHHGLDAPSPSTRTACRSASTSEFASNPNAMAWLWKDHTGFAEAAEITALAAREHPEYLAKCGGTYSSEWFFSKILHCLRDRPEGLRRRLRAGSSAATGSRPSLTGETRPDRIKRSRCAAGHKAMFNAAWGGLPAAEFLAKLDPKLGALRGPALRQDVHLRRRAGGLSPAWAQTLGLPAGIARRRRRLRRPPGRGRLGHRARHAGQDHRHQHLRHDASGRATSRWPTSPGLCGIVDGSVLPGYFGLEAGQSAVGDIFNWFVERHPARRSAQRLARRPCTKAAARLQPGAIRPAGPGLEQRQPHDPGRPAADRPAPRPDAPHHAGRDLPRPDRGHGLRRPDHHQALRGIRRPDRRGRQLRRHRREEPAGHADLRRRDRPGDEGLPLGPDLRPRLGHRRRRGRGAKRAATPDFAAAQAAMCGVKARAYKPDPKAHAGLRRALSPSTASCTTPSARTTWHGLALST